VYISYVFFVPPTGTATPPTNAACDPKLSRRSHNSHRLQPQPTPPTSAAACGPNLRPRPAPPRPRPAPPPVAPTCATCDPNRPTGAVVPPTAVGKLVMGMGIRRRAVGKKEGRCRWARRRKEGGGKATAGHRCQAQARPRHQRTK
jgi:hypothetical protein